MATSSPDRIPHGDDRTDRLLPPEAGVHERAAVHLLWAHRDGSWLDRLLSSSGSDTDPLGAVVSHDDEGRPRIDWVRLAVLLAGGEVQGRPGELLVLRVAVTLAHGHRRGTALTTLDGSGLHLTRTPVGDAGPDIAPPPLETTGT